MRKKTNVFLIMMAVFMLALSACGPKEAADTDASATEKTDKEDKEEKEDRDEDKEESEVPDLEGTYWVAEDGEGELFFNEDGTFYYRKLMIMDDGLPGYSTIGAGSLTWEQKGKKVEFAAKWGYAPEDSNEDVDSFKGSIKDDKLVVGDIPGCDEKKITFVEGDRPELPSLDDAPGMVGEWRMIASSLEGSLEIYEEGDWHEKYLQITEKGGKYYASGQNITDGEISGEWSDIGMTLVEEPVYEGFMNSCWRADLDEETEGGIWREVTLYNDNILTLVESNYDDDPSQDYIFISYQYFVRDGEDTDEIVRDFFCPRKVNVSDVHELAAAIEPCTEITLEGGVYNLSELGEDDESEYLIYSMPMDDDVWLDIMCDRLAIRAADGEDVEIVTKNPMAPVIKIQNSNAVWIEGITAGHMVDVGGCGGAVIRLTDSAHIYINDCSLYGCGIYGIDAVFTTGISAKGTEIYDCSDGAVFLDEYSTLHLYDCRIHDNTDTYGDLFGIMYDSHLTAENCEIRNNDNEYGKIVAAYHESTADFLNCRFTDNDYSGNFDSDDKEAVIFTNCEFDD